VDFGRIYQTETTITEAGLESSSAKWIDADSVIVAMYGNTAAKVAISKIPLTTNQACCNITVDRTKADYRFLYYWLFKEYNSLKSLANGGAQQNLNASIIRNYKIIIPDLPTQRRIAEILSALDDKIELNRRMNQTLEQMAQTLFRQYFVDGIDEENLPEEWKIGKIGDIYKTTSGGTPGRSKPEYYGDDIPWIKSKELNGGFIFETEEKITKEGLKKSSAKLLPTHSVLVAMYGATVGEISITSIEATCNQAICAILPNIGYPYTFIFQFLKESKEELINRATGSAQQNISQELIQSFEIVIPPVDVVQRYHHTCIELFNKIEANVKEIQTLTTLRDTLLPKLMSGEIDVTQTQSFAQHEPVLS
jgi:type I restriction enzyme S subunit